MTKQNRNLTLKLQSRPGGIRNLGTLTVHAEEPVASRTVVEITFRCSRLDNKDLFSKSVCFRSFFPFLRMLHLKYDFI